LPTGEVDVDVAGTARPVGRRHTLRQRPAGGVWQQQTGVFEHKVGVDREPGAAEAVVGADRDQRLVVAVQRAVEIEQVAE
jgi:hypothetical protein